MLASNDNIMNRRIIKTAPYQQQKLRRQRQRQRIQTTNNTFFNTKYKIPILLLLTILLNNNNYIVVVNAECSTCDPCIGRSVNYIQCPNTNCGEFVQCNNGVTSQHYTCDPDNADPNLQTIFSGGNGCSWVAQGATCGEEPNCLEPDPEDTSGCEDITTGTVCATPCFGQADGVWIQVPGTNRKKFTQCYSWTAGGAAANLIECSEGLIFNGVNACDYKESVTTCLEDTQCLSEDPSGGGTSGCEDITGGTECLTPCFGQADGTFIQVPGTNRQKFTQCYSWTAGGAAANLIECSEGLIFNGLNACDYKESVTTCLEDTECLSEDPSGGGTSGCEDITGGTECLTPCFGQADGAWIQVPGTNRKKFTQCYSGSAAHLIECSEGLHFNGVNACDYKESVTTCLEDTECLSEDPSGGGTSGCEDLTDLNVCDTPCVGQADGALIQVPGTNRQKFVQCMSGSAVQNFDCAEGQIFNGVNACDFKERVTTCLEDTQCLTEDPSGGGTSGCEDLTDLNVCDTPCVGQADGALIQVPGTNRQKFVQCMSGSAVQNFDCAEGQIFNGVNACDFKERVTTCLEDTQCLTEDPSGGGTSGCEDLTDLNVCDTPCVGQADGALIQVPGTNRQKFVQCMSGSAVQNFDCAEGQIFNGVNACDFKERVTTCLQDTTCEQGDPSGGGGCEDITGGTECATPCIDQDGGYKPGGMVQIAGTNRDKYTQCSGLGTGIVYSCSDLGPDYVFDSALQVCHLKTLATCGDDPICHEPQPNLGTTRLGSISKQENIFDEDISSQARVAGMGVVVSAWIIMFIIM